MKLKKVISGILSAAMLACCALSPELPELCRGAVVTAHASTVWGDYEYYVIKDQAVIMDYRGSEKDVEIPAEIEGYKVVKLRGTFRENKTIENVIIPDSVKFIGEFSFFDCENLKTVKFPKSLVKIDKYAFCKCPRLKSADLPDCTEEIGIYAFYNCMKLERVTIPDGVSVLGECAFSGCIKLRNVNIPKKIKKIEAEVFYGCSELLRAEIPDNVKRVGARAFMYCSSLARLTLSENLESTGVLAFAGCTKLTDVVIPSKIVELDNIFEQCTELKSVYIPKSVKEISSDIFLYCGEDLTIYGESDSRAEDFARRRKINFSSGELPVTKPSVPAFFKVAKKDSGEAKINWDAVGNADGYELYMSPSKDGEFTRLNDFSDYMKDSCVKAGLSAGKTYYFKMRTYKLVGGKKLYGSFTLPMKVKV